MAPRPGLDKAGVVQAAAALADQSGLEQISLATLSEKLGVRTPTLYHYVNGLPGLNHELALLGTHELGLRLGRAVMGKAGDDAVMALAHAYRAFAKEHPGLYAASQRSAQNSPDSELIEAQAQVTETALLAVAAYKLEHDEAIHVVRAIRSMIHGFATLEISDGFGIPLDVDESFNRMLEVFLRGLHQQLC